ncbi:MAG: 2OG-Fe dioxygenase family protein [Cyanobacteria bacterium SBLK]|nr:2OG-Fe dioxygenase family protein [Cyanobacteria bacterium SBLK]
MLLPNPSTQYDELCIRAKNLPAFTLSLLEETERFELLASVGELGPDPSSRHFTKRTKNIAFVFSERGNWFQIAQNFFNQAVYYNSFSGGYKRYYRELPREFLQCQVTQKILSQFQKIYEIPENELILVQVQTSHVYPGDENKCLTGQGIHSDGADKAMLICLKRENIDGARNAIYADRQGKKAVLSPFVLQAGDALFWKDNTVYHYVESARARSEWGGTRTVLLAHYPAIYYLNGRVNPNNRLIVDPRSISL